MNSPASGGWPVGGGFPSLPGNRLLRVADGLPNSGVWLTETQAYNDRNQLIHTQTYEQEQSSEITDTWYAYDANGNRTSKTVNGPGIGYSQSYEYDVANRLVQGSTSGWGVVFEAYYDARTRRIAKTEDFGSGDVRTMFRYDGGTNFQELRDNDVVTELVRAGGLGGGIGSVLYSDQTMAPTPGPWEGFVYNAVGHTTVLTDSTGTPTQQNLYEAFGQTILQSGGTNTVQDPSGIAIVVLEAEPAAAAPMIFRTELSVPTTSSWGTPARA